MNSIYLEDLRSLKATFNPGNEGPLIAEAVSISMPKGPLRILDVGIGEARSTFRALELLGSQGYAVHLTGLDLHISERVRRLALPGSEFQECDFQLLPFEEVFDVVISTQSLYYLGEWEVSLRKLLSHARPKGCLAVTLWTENCSLHRLHNRFAQCQKNNLLTAENVAQAAQRQDSSATVRLVRTRGTINVRMWREEARIGAAAFRILSRLEEQGTIDPVAYGKFSEHIKSLQDEEPRENGTVFVLRGPELQTK